MWKNPRLKEAREVVCDRRMELIRSQEIVKV
jgi:hypothetical protein